MPNISVSDSIAVADGTLADRDFPTDVIGVVDRGQEITKNVIRSSLRIENNLSRQVDICRYRVKSYGAYTFVPKVGDEIKVFRGSEKVFAGNIVEVTQSSEDYRIIEYSVTANDYGRRLDRYLINDSFANMTVKEIINQIIADKGLAQENFSTAGVMLDDQVSYVAFKYEPLSSVLSQLADILNADWYVDYNRVIYFVGREDLLSPFDLSDDDGTFIFDTFSVKRDNTQIKNVVYVRGGEFLGNTFTTEYVSNGIQNVYNLPYRYEDLRVTVTGAEWTQGVDGTDNLTTVDYIWNKLEKFIRFRGDRVPSNTSQIRVSGAPFLPVLVKLKNNPSVKTMMTAEGGSGEYEHVIIDPTINSKEGARERARAELEAYKDTLSEGGFTTYMTGLRSGQTINVNSEAYQINEDFVINKVVFNPWTDNDFVYDVSFLTTKSFGMVDFLRALLTKERKNIVINENEILDSAEAEEEELELLDTMVTSSFVHNPQAESMTMSETTTAQSLNYDVQFVLGDQTPPSGKKRVFILNYSPLH